MSDQTAASWLSETRSKLHDQSDAIAEALNDLAVGLGDESDRGPTTWVDLRHGVTVYVLTPGLLHRFSGNVDLPAGDPRQDERESSCDYATFAITPSAHFSLAVTTRAGPNNARTVEREWTFRFRDEPKSESIRVVTQTKPQESDEATAFARALAGSIANVSR
jgi:hypothetical protein